jgi:hypothetical protein
MRIRRLSLLLPRAQRMRRWSRNSRLSVADAPVPQPRARDALDLVAVAEQQVWCDAVGSDGGATGGREVNLGELPKEFGRTLAPRPRLPSPGEPLFMVSAVMHTERPVQTRDPTRSDQEALR